MTLRKRVSTPEEIEARQLTEIWNSPIQPTSKPTTLPPLFCGVPWFDSVDVLTPGHTPDCNCGDCWAAFAYRQSAATGEVW